MTDTSFEFGQLFSLSRDAVVCTRNDTIIYMNPSAIALFNGDYSGMSAHQIIPGQFLTGDLDQFIASVEIREKNMTFSCSTHEDIRLYSIVLPEEKMERSVIQSISVPLRDLTNTIKVTADRILALSDQYQDEKLSQYSAILKHSSSKLKRIILNYSIYAACQEGTAKFSPTLVCVNEICQELVNAVADLYHRGFLRRTVCFFLLGCDACPTDAAESSMQQPSAHPGRRFHPYETQGYRGGRYHPDQ